MDSGKVKILWSSRSWQDFNDIHWYTFQHSNRTKAAVLVLDIQRYIHRRLGGEIDGGMPDHFLNRYSKDIRKVIYGNYRISYIKRENIRIILRVFDNRMHPEKNL